MGRSMPQSDGRILTDEIIDKLRAAVFTECGIAINRDDPVFSAVILNKIILDGYVQQIVESLSAITEASKAQDRAKGSHTQEVQNQPNPTEGINQALHHNRTRLLEELSPIINEKVKGSRQPTTELLSIGLVVAVASLATNFLFHFMSRSL